MHEPCRHQTVLMPKVSRRDLFSPDTAWIPACQPLYNSQITTLNICCQQISFLGSHVHTKSNRKSKARGPNVSNSRPIRMGIVWRWGGSTQDSTVYHIIVFIEIKHLKINIWITVGSLGGFPNHAKSSQFSFSSFCSIRGGITKCNAIQHSSSQVAQSVCRSFFGPQPWLFMFSPWDIKVLSH